VTSKGGWITVGEVAEELKLSPGYTPSSIRGRSCRGRMPEML
jgi:hypothetical protein